MSTWISDKLLNTLSMQQCVMRHFIDRTVDDTTFYCDTDMTYGQMLPWFLFIWLVSQLSGFCSLWLLILVSSFLCLFCTLIIVCYIVYLFLCVTGAVTYDGRTSNESSLADAEVNTKKEPSVVDVEMYLGRSSEPSVMDPDMNWRRGSPATDSEMNMRKGPCVTDLETNIKIPVKVDMKKEPSVSAMDLDRSMCKEKTFSMSKNKKNMRNKPPVSDLDVYMNKNTGVKETELDVKNDISVKSVMETVMSIKKEPSCMATGEGTGRETTLIDAGRDIKLEPYVPETDMDVMKQTRMETERNFQKEPSVMDLGHTSDRWTEMNIRNEMPGVESVQLKSEPGLCHFQESSSESRLVPNFDTPLHIKSEPVEDPAAIQQKLIVKFKSKTTKRFQPVSKRGHQSARRKEQGTSKPAASSDSDADVLIKCEPSLDFGHQAEMEGGSEEQHRSVAHQKTLTKKNKTPPLCSHCQEHFCSRSSLKRHYKRKHSTESLPFSCKECDAVFARWFQLRAHERKHRGGDKKFPCQECDVIFTRACHLKIHMRKHTGERPFSCKDCSATFRSTSNLKRHRMKHSGLRPYVCTVCSADFYQSSQLVSHIRKHTGERPFTCVECDATFTQVTHLHRHMAKHTGKKPYLCCECGAAFVENCALKNHLQRHRRRAESSSAGGKKPKKQAPSKVSGGLQS